MRSELWMYKPKYTHKQRNTFTGTSKARNVLPIKSQTKRQLFVLKKLNINQLTSPGVCAFGKFDWLTASVNQNNTIGQKITNRHLVQLDFVFTKGYFYFKDVQKVWVVGGGGGGWW